MHWISGFVMFGILCGNAVDAKSGSRRRVREYSAKIMSRPDDIPVVKCGEDVRLTCIAEGEPVPEIEWWYSDQTPDQSQKEIIRNLARDGRVKIKTEELYVIRSTLIIRDAEEIDEGVYQCRASNSRARRSKNINLYQHWKIEEVPLHKVMCKDAVLTRTEVVPASKYNQSVFDDAVERAITSFAVTTSSSNPLTNHPQSTTAESTKSVQADEETTTSTTKRTATTSSSMSSSTQHVITESQIPDMKTNKAGRAKPGKPQRNVIKDITDDQSKIPLTETSQYRSSEEETAYHRRTQDGCRNSGISVKHQGLAERIFYVITSFIMMSRWS